jgi:hypothetical protein
VIDSGRFTPNSYEGRRLLAHELTHVVQQSAAATSAGVKGRETGARLAGSAEISEARQAVYCETFKGAKSSTQAKLEHEADRQLLTNKLIELLRSQPPEIQAEVDFRRTIALALVDIIDENGEVAMIIVYAASGNWNKSKLEESADRLGIHRLGHEGITPREEGPRKETKAAQDAEQLLIEGAEQFDSQIRLIVAHRKICAHCSEAIDEANIKATWLDPAARKAGLAAGRLYKRGSKSLQKALTELHQAFGQESKEALASDSPLWGTLSTLPIKELYQILELARRSGQLETLTRSARNVRNLDMTRVITVMSALLYKEEFQKASPDGIRLLVTSSYLISGLESLSKDERTYLERTLSPQLRSVVKPAPVAPPPKAKSTKTDTKMDSKKAPAAEETSTGISAIAKKALIAAGIVLTGLALLELAEAIATALFFELILAITADALKGAAKTRIAEVVTEEVKKRVAGVSVQQIEKVTENLLHDLEPYLHTGAGAVGAP